MDKIINVFKPSGITSHDLVDQVRAKYPGVKVGHAGTLDPMASGVMIIGLGKACKKLGEFTKLDKDYLAKVVFGLSSPTDDLDADKIRKLNIPKLDKRKISQALIGFRGKIEQRVPLFSATHYKSEKLYKRARKGEKIPLSKLPSKEVEIKHLELTAFKDQGYEFDNIKLPMLELEVTCSSGTYIRSLARDLGSKLRTKGILVELTRTRIGDYNIKDSIKLMKKGS